jgi:hypothetical protein
MHEKTLADSLDLWFVLSLESGLSTTKLPHSCLSQDLIICMSLAVFAECMVESPGEKKLRLTKQRQTRELRARTSVRLSEVKAVNRGVASDIEDKGTQYSDNTPCLSACLFGFILLVANLLFIQWLCQNIGATG